MMTSAPKVVVSTTLDDPGWGPTTVISSDVAAELTKLKHQPGKNINVGASGTLVTFLLQEDLLDELLLFVHPVLIGTGKHLFEAGNDRVALQLLESKAHDNGVVALRYGRPVTAP
jgi:dihydrofolate reductase